MSRTATLQHSVAASLTERSKAIQNEATALEQIRQHLAELPRQISEASATSAEAMATALEPLAVSLAALSQETSEALSAARQALQDAQSQAAKQAQQQAEALTSATTALTGLHSRAETARSAQSSALQTAETSLTNASLALAATRQTLLEGQRQSQFAASDSLRRALIGAGILAVLAIGSPWAVAWWTGSLTSPLQQSQRADAEAWGRAVAATWQTLPPQAQVQLQQARERQTAQR